MAIKVTRRTGNIKRIQVMSSVRFQSKISPEDPQSVPINLRVSVCLFKVGMGAKKPLRCDA
jgi:hypothetical protein